ncbi:MAG: EamA family transporter [Ignavibacteria bacterium]|nr:EamA family transporter [Ignavibacteria bacterium]
MTSSPKEAALPIKAMLTEETLSEMFAEKTPPQSAPHVPRQRSSRTTFYIAFSAVCLIWGSTYLGVRFAIETLPPLLMAGVRFTIAGCIMFAWARASGSAMPSWQEWRSASIVGAMLVTFCNGAFTLAMGRVPSSLGALVATSLPIWMVLLDWLRPEGKRPTGGVMIGIALGFSGIVVLVQPWHYFMQSANDASSHPLDFIGFVLMFFGTIAWAVGSIYARHANLPATPRMTTAIELLSGGVIMLVIALFAGEASQIHPDKISLKSFTAFLYLIVFGSIAAFSAYTWLLQNVSAALASSYTYVNPVIAMLLGATLGGESITANMIAAMIVIMMAVGMIAKYRTPNAS